jgi:hypothetical protein
LVSSGGTALSGEMSFATTVEAGSGSSIAIYLGDMALELSSSPLSMPGRGASAPEVHGDCNIVHPSWRIARGKQIVISWGGWEVPLKLSQRVLIILIG